MVELIGSEKQIAWATEIREQMGEVISNIDTYIENFMTLPRIQKKLDVYKAAKKELINQITNKFMEENRSNYIIEYFGKKDKDSIKNEMADFILENASSQTNSRVLILANLIRHNM